jgi:hypothetical protein
MTRTDYRLLAIVALIMTMLAIVNATFAVPVAPRAGGDDAVTLINQYRASRGLVALRSDSRLAGAADFHNRWMRDNDCFAHQCAGEPDPWARIRAAGYSYSKAGEVIGRGYQDAASVVSGWRNSAPHDAIITDTYVDIGCAMLEDERSRETWWTCALASSGRASARRATATRRRGRLSGAATRMRLRSSAAGATARPTMQSLLILMSISAARCWKTKEAAKRGGRAPWRVAARPYCPP